MIMSTTYLLLLLSQLTGNVYFKFGPDSGMNFIKHKYFTAGYTSELNGLLDQQFEIGGWASGESGERNSLYGSYQTGVKTKGTFYAQVFSGVALITAPDCRLSSVLQFKHDVGIGIKDERNVGIGLDYSHISNAGITLPNLGRDMLQVRVEFPFN